MIRLRWFPVLFLVSVTLIPAAFEPRYTGVRALGMAGAGTAVGEEPDAPFGNPAAIPARYGIWVNGSVFRPFGLTALQSQTATVALALKRGTVYGGAMLFGKREYYREGVYLAGYRYRINRELAVALSAKYMTVAILPLYGSDWCAGLDAGILWQPRPGFAVGAMAVNLNAPSIGVTPESVTRVIKGGIALRPRRGLLLALDTEKETLQPVRVMAGQEIRFFKYLLLRAGIRTAPARFSVGGGIDLGWFAADYAFTGHYDLGGSHQVRMYLVYNRLRSGDRATP